MRLLRRKDLHVDERLLHPRLLANWRSRARISNEACVHPSFELALRKTLALSLEQGFKKRLLGGRRVRSLQGIHRSSGKRRGSNELQRNQSCSDPSFHELILQTKSARKIVQCVKFVKEFGNGR